MKRKIFIIPIGFLSVIALLTIARGRSCSQADGVLPVYGGIPIAHTGNELVDLKRIPSITPYKSLPRKELIFSFKKLNSPHGSDIIELLNGDLFAAWNADKPGAGDAAVWGSRKPAGAVKWTEPVIIHDTPGRADKNPVLYTGQDNKLFLFWTLEKNRNRWWHEDKVWLKTSNDMGNSWAEPYDIGAPSGSLTKTSPIRLRNGWIVLPIYIDWCTSSLTLTSKDGGVTWRDLSRIIPLFGTQPTVIQRSDSSLFALMRSGMWPRRAWLAVSNDFGCSWKKQRVSDVKNPGSSLQMTKLRNGHVVLAFNNSKSYRRNLSLALSYDEGKTWSHIRAIEDDRGFEHSYPSIMQDRYGLIHVVYSCHDRKVIAHFVTDEQWIKESEMSAKKQAKK